MQLVFTYADGRTATAQILPIDRIMFERKFQTSVVTAVSVDQREEYLFWLGWHALNRMGQADSNFEQWLALVSDYEAASEPEVPSDPVANTGS